MKRWKKGRTWPLPWGNIVSDEHSRQIHDEILHKAKFTKRLQSETAVWKRAKIRSNSDLKCQKNFYRIWYKHQRIKRVLVVRNVGKFLHKEN